MIKKWSKSLIGKKVTVAGSSGTYVIRSEYKSSRPAANLEYLYGECYGSYNLSEITLISIDVNTLKRDIEGLEAELKLAKEKLQFLIDNNLQEWDEDIFKAVQAIKLFSLAGDDAMEKAKKLIDIINN